MGKGKGKGKGCLEIKIKKSTNTEHRHTPYRPDPSKPTSSDSQTIAFTTDDDALPNEVVPRQDGEYERLFSKCG